MLDGMYMVMGRPRINILIDCPEKQTMGLSHRFITKVFLITETHVGPTAVLPFRVPTRVFCGWDICGFPLSTQPCRENSPKSRQRSATSSERKWVRAPNFLGYFFIIIVFLNILRASWVFMAEQALALSCQLAAAEQEWEWDTPGKADCPPSHKRR